MIHWWLVTTCGVGGEVAALIAEGAFEYHVGMITRVAAPDIPMPYSPPLADAYHPNAAKILAAACELRKNVSIISQLSMTLRVSCGFADTDGHQVLRGMWMAKASAVLPLV